MTGVQTCALPISDQTLIWNVGSSHTIATTSPQAGITGTQYVYANWSDSGAMSHSVAPSVNSIYTANFTTQYQLNTTFDPTKGYVLPNAGGWYNSGTVVNLTATPNSGNVFTNWTGNTVANPNSAATTITMDSFKSVTANFGGIPALTARVTGKTGTVDNRLWTITLTNTGTGTASNVYITSLTITAGNGTTCTPPVASGLPLLVGDVAVGSPQTGTVTLDFSACTPASKFNTTITYSYTGGSGSNSYYNMLR